MLKRFDITLSRSQRAVFPDRCVACDRPSSGHKYKFVTSSIGWSTLAHVFGWLWIPGTRVSVRVPTCHRCAWIIRVRYWGALLAMVTIMAIVIWLLNPLLSDLNNTVRRLILFAACLIAIIPIVAIDRFLPPAFDITASADTVNYEFVSPVCALEFMELNTSEDRDARRGVRLRT
jgi:hypothetical protein